MRQSSNLIQLNKDEEKPPEKEEGIQPYGKPLHQQECQRKILKQWEKQASSPLQQDQMLIPRNNTHSAGVQNSEKMTAAKAIQLWKGSNDMDRTGTPTKAEFQHEELDAIRQRMKVVIQKNQQKLDMLEEHSDTTAEKSPDQVLKELIENYLINDDDEESSPREIKKGESQQQETIDFSKVSASEQYFEMVSHQIPLSDLYQIVNQLSSSQENRFAAILIKIQNKELQKSHQGRYLLQVWSRAGKLVYSLTLQCPIHQWTLAGNNFTYVKGEQEPKDPQFRHFQLIYVVELQEKQRCKEVLLVSSEFQFYELDYGEKHIDRHLTFCDDFLIVATLYTVKYVEVPKSTFIEIPKQLEHAVDNYDGKLQFHKLKASKEVIFKSGVRFLKFIEINDGRCCAVTEQMTGPLMGCISFLGLKINPGKFKVVILDQLNDQCIRKPKEELKSDPIVDFKSIIFKEEISNKFKQCAIALRTSGSVDYLWNFRVVDTFVANDLVKEGFITEIYYDFGWIYLKKIFVDADPALVANLSNPKSKDYKNFISVFSKIEPEHINNSSISEDEQQEAKKPVKQDEKSLKKKKQFLSKIKVRQVLFKCCLQWKERIGKNTQDIKVEGPDQIKRMLSSIQNQHVANFMKLYPWFSNMQTHFCIAHLNFLSIYNIDTWQWSHTRFEKDQLIENGFRIQDKKTELYWAGLVIKSDNNPYDDRIAFVRASDGLRGAPATGIICEKCKIEREKHAKQRGKPFKRQQTISDLENQICHHQTEFKLPNGDLAYRPVEQKFGGEVLTVAIDKQQQKFVIFLVKKFKVEEDIVQTFVQDSSTSESDRYISKRLTGIYLKPEQQQLSLRIYVANCDANNTLKRLRIDKSLLTDDSEMFVIPSKKGADEAFIIIDSCKDLLKPKSDFFRLYHYNTKPIMHRKEMDNFDRPINVDAEIIDNKLVGYIDHGCDDQTDARVFVTRNDVVVTKIDNECLKTNNTDDGAPDFEGTLYYKYFTERNIQAILQLDSWMYTLSNPCEVFRNLTKFKEKEQGGCEGLKVHHTSSYFDKMGNPIESGITDFLNDEETLVPDDKIQQDPKLKSKKGKVEEKPVFNGSFKENPGLYAYDLQRLANSGDLITYGLKDAVVGVNRHIDFCNSSYRISFLKSFDSIEMIPVPHRNTLNFLGMETKQNYFIWRESQGVLTALHKNLQIQAWQIGTGKKIKPTIMVGTLDLDGFEIYQCNKDDDSYKRNWQQHPQKTIALLKSKKRLDNYEMQTGSILEDHTDAYIRDYRRHLMRPNCYMFKCLTMDDHFAEVEFSFLFDYRCNDNLKSNQIHWLILSRDLTKLLELYSDSRCSIYTRSKEMNKSLVVWVPTWNIQKFPLPLQGLSYANFLFSPNFNFFIDANINNQEFVIKASKTNETVCRIPNDLYRFRIGGDEVNGLRVLASRMVFEQENVIRIISKDGIDTILELNVDEAGKCVDLKYPVCVKSTCKIDHFDPKVTDEKHAILDAKFIKPELTLQRLVRTTQQFKVKQYHLKDALHQRENQRILNKKYKITDATDPNQINNGYNDELDKDFVQESNEMQKASADVLRDALAKQLLEDSDPDNDDQIDDLSVTINEEVIDENTISSGRIYSRLMHEELFKVDYSQPIDQEQSQLVAEMTFTILDWQIIERIISPEAFHIGLVDRQRIVQLCFNIFPKLKTVLHMFVEAQIDIPQLKCIFTTTANYTLFGDMKVAVPVLQNIDDLTALDLALNEEKTVNLTLANQILEGIENYPFMHSGFALVTGINKSLVHRVPHLAQYLDSRRVKSGHLDTKSLSRQAIRAEALLDNGDYKYGTLVTDSWQEKNKLVEQIFDREKLAKTLIIRYFDIPQLHEFGKEGHKFFEELENTNDIRLFETEVVQIIITHKWNLIAWFIKYMLFAPYCLLLITNLVWHVKYRPVRSQCRKQNNITAVIVLIQVLYFVFIEIRQAIGNAAEYFTDTTNLFNLLPLFSCTQSVIISLVYDEPKDGASMHWYPATCTMIGIQLLWQNLFYYLRISRETGYLSRMIEECMRVSIVFFLIYMLSHFAFAQGFLFISLAAENHHKHHFAESYMSALRYSFFNALGDYQYKPQFESNSNNMKYIGMVLLILACLITSVVMLNLLIAIISDKYGDVNDKRVVYMYQEQASMIAQYQRLLPQFLLKSTREREQEMMQSQKLLLVIEEAEEDAGEKQEKENEEKQQMSREDKNILKNIEAKMDEMCTELHSLKDDFIVLNKMQDSEKDGSAQKPKRRKIHLAIQRQKTFQMDPSKMSPDFRMKTKIIRDAIQECSDEETDFYDEMTSED